jgi:hypothetical protein
MAAGLGFKTFTTGEVLTAADTNGYLMQGVLVFASSAARAAAVTSPQEGQYSYLKDTNSTEYYDGAAWIAAPIGDITGVTAGTGISGGGTSGTVTITNSMATEITAKGDLIAGTGSATFDNLAVGTNGQTLVADSTASTGLKWATPSSSLPALVGVNLSKAGASTSLTASVISYLTFTTEIYDTNAFHDNTNNTRITIPASYGGKYLFTGFIGLGGAGSNTFEIFLRKNGATDAIPGGRIVLLPNNAGNTAAAAWTAMIELVATDYIEVGIRVAATSTFYTLDALFQATYLGA